MSAVTEIHRVRFGQWRIVLLPLAIFAIGLAAFHALETRRPDRLYHAGYVLRDEGANLFVAETLLDGGVPYRDVAYQYGPVSAYSLACGALALGRTPHGYLLATHVINLLAIVLVAHALSSASSNRLPLLWVACVLFPMMGVPAMLLPSYSVSIYISLERVCIGALLCLWSEPGSRTRWRVLAIAGVVAMWQSVRFGGAEVGLVTLILLDILSSRDGVFASVRSLFTDWLCWIGGAIGASTLTFAVLLALMPAEVALDAVVPSYVLRAYDQLYVWGCSQYPAWTSIAVFVAHQLVLAASALLSVWILWSIARGIPLRQGLTPVWAIAAFGAVYFAVGCVTIFRHEFHYYQFGWLLSLAWLPLLEKYGRRATIAMLVVTAPSMAFVVKQIAITPAPAALQAVQLMNGVELYCNADERNIIQSLVSTAEQVNDSAGDSTERQRVLILVQAPGAPPMLGIHAYGRNYLHLPGFVRDYDQRQLLSDLDMLRAVVVVQDGTWVRSGELAQFEHTMSADVIAAIESRVVGVTDSADGLVRTYWIGP